MAANNDRFLITADKIFDGEKIIDDDTVIICGNRIEKICKKRELSGDAITECSFGGVIMPGMIDMHIHALMSAEADPAYDIVNDGDAVCTARGVMNLRSLLFSGVTTARDLGGRGGICFELADAIERGIIAGPRLITSGRGICMTGGHGYFFSEEVDGPYEARKAARKLIKEGAKTLKVLATGGVMTAGMRAGAPQMELEEIAEVCKVGAKAGKITASHAQGKEGIINSLKGGCKTIEHGFEIEEEALDLFLKNDAYLTPTFIAGRNIAGGGEKGTPQWMVEKIKPFLEIQAKSYGRAAEAGVKILCGTDAGTPHNTFGETYKEIIALAEMGVSNIEALKAATSNAADCLDMPEIGRIKEGCIADIIVLQRNPADDLSILAEPVSVIKDGRFIRNLTKIS